MPICDLHAPYISAFSIVMMSQKNLRGSISVRSTKCRQQFALVVWITGSESKICSRDHFKIVTRESIYWAISSGPTGRLSVLFPFKNNNEFVAVNFSSCLWGLSVNLVGAFCSYVISVIWLIFAGPISSVSYSSSSSLSLKYDVQSLFFSCIWIDCLSNFCFQLLCH